MKYFAIFLSVFVMLFISIGCSEKGINQPQFQASTQTSSNSVNTQLASQNYKELSFHANFYPINIDLKRIKKGEANFRFDELLENIKFDLTVYDVANITEANIYIEEKDIRDRIPVVELYPAKRVSPSQNDPRIREIAKGVITSKDLRGSLSGMRLETLYKYFLEKKAYIIVSTERHLEGEIKGLILPPYMLQSISTAY